MSVNAGAGRGIEEEYSTKEQDPKLLQTLWALFSSMKTAITLLLLLATLSILGTVIQQNGIPEEYLRIYGARKYAFFRALGLTDVYHSTWYRLLLFLVSTNLVVCSINRLGNAWRQAQQPKVSVPKDAILKMQRSEKLSSRQSVKDSVERLVTSLKAGGYRVAEERDSDDVALVASKGNGGLWGPYLTHLSILVIFIGAIYGGLFGFEGYTTITEGQSTSAYMHRGSNSMANLGFRVALRDFRVEYDEHHNPTAYKSDLQVYEGSKLVVQKVIDVNHPLTHRGISFHQSDYGMDSLVLKVTDPAGKSEYVTFAIETGASPMGKEFALAGEPFREIRLGGGKVTIFAHDFIPDYSEEHHAVSSTLPINPAIMLMANDRFPEYKGLEAWSNLGWLETSKPVEYKDLTIELERAVDYSGLQVSSNPGLYVIYAGFGIMLFGLFLSFYIQRMILRARVSTANKGSVIVVGATCRAGADVFDNDFRRLQETFSQ